MNFLLAYDRQRRGEIKHAVLTLTSARACGEAAPIRSPTRQFLPTARHICTA